MANGTPTVLLAQGLSMIWMTPSRPLWPAMAGEPARCPAQWHGTWTDLMRLGRTGCWAVAHIAATLSREGVVRQLNPLHILTMGHREVSQAGA